jgi:hypothetical protein
METKTRDTFIISSIETITTFYNIFQKKLEVKKNFFKNLELSEKNCYNALRSKMTKITILERTKKPKYPSMLEVISGFTTPTFKGFMDALRKSAIVLVISVAIILPLMDFSVHIIKTKILWFLFV